MHRSSLVFTALLALTLSACLFKKSDHPQACRVSKDCESGKCSSGFCVTEEDGGSRKPGKDAGGGGTKGDGGGGQAGNQAGESCEDGQPPMDCYDGEASTEDIGMCRGGQRACVSGKYTQCLGQTVPAEEVCNGKDDDCDGNTDEIQMGDCETQMDGVCNAGALQCRGQYPVCEPIKHASNEECNGKDDDCDGKTDEALSDVPCYPKGEIGCEIGADGRVSCIGTCRIGHQECKNGHSTCAGANTPHDEVCTAGQDAIAADENCDGQADEDCSCKSGDTQLCYNGLPGTEGHGTCKAGKQTCVGNTWGGNCVGEVGSESETCANPGADNDCNDHTDDVPRLGSDCIGGLGECAEATYQCTAADDFECVSKKEKQPEECDEKGLDLDCDGDPSNGFDLHMDNNNCGSCGVRCDERETSCCADECWPLKAFREDRANCGACGHECGRNEGCCQGKCVAYSSTASGGPGLPGPIEINACQCQVECGEDQVCCGTECVNLNKDSANCGACGKQCNKLLGCSAGTCAIL